MRLILKRLGWWRLTPMLVLCLPVLLLGQSAWAVDFPGPDPQQAKATVDHNRFVLENEVIRCEWMTGAGRLKPVCVEDKLSKTTLSLGDGECFRFVVARTPVSEGRLVRASDLQLVGKPKLTVLKPSPGSLRLAERRAGRQIAVELASADGNLKLQWRVVLRDGSNYLRQYLQILAKRESVELQDLALVDVLVPGAAVAGSVDGSPVVVGQHLLWRRESDVEERGDSIGSADVGALCLSLSSGGGSGQGSGTLVCGGCGAGGTTPARVSLLHRAGTSTALSHVPALQLWLSGWGGVLARAAVRQAGGV